MPSDESKGSQLDAIGALAQRQLDNTDLWPISKGPSFGTGRACSAITTATLHRSSGAPAGRNGWSEGELCSGSPIAEPVPRRLVSANFDNASRIRDFGSVRIFGHDECAAAEGGRPPEGSRIDARPTEESHEHDRQPRTHGRGAIHRS